MNSKQNILSLSPVDLLLWLQENCEIEIPEKITTIEDLKNAGELISRLTSMYSYIMSCFLFSKVAVRDAKKNKLSKEEINDCIDRRDILESFANTLKLQYTAVSRMITVKKQIDEELKMLNGSI